MGKYTTGNYIRGRAQEWRVKRLLEAAGWLVVRSAGSHGPADLVALRGGDAALVQVKMTNRETPPTYVAERIRLVQAAQKSGFPVWLWVWVSPFRRWHVWVYRPGGAWCEVSYPACLRRGHEEGARGVSIAGSEDVG